jgi:hypothetical protein
MSALFVMACLYGPCVSHGYVLQIPIPSVHPGRSEAVYTREYNGDAVIIYVPKGASI